MHSTTWNARQIYSTVYKKIHLIYFRESERVYFILWITYGRLLRFHKMTYWNIQFRNNYFARINNTKTQPLEQYLNFSSKNHCKTFFGYIYLVWVFLLRQYWEQMYSTYNIRIWNCVKNRVSTIKCTHIHAPHFNNEIALNKIKRQKVPLKHHQAFIAQIHAKRNKNFH